MVQMMGRCKFVP